VIQIPVGPNTDPVPVTLPYSFPSGAAILSASESEVGADRIITVNMRSSVATGGSLLIKAELSSGLIVVACLGSASVPNLGLQPGQAAILNESGTAVVGSATVFVDGDSVAISLDSSLASAASLETVSTNYAPEFWVQSFGPEVVEMYPGSVLDLDPSIVASSPPLIIRSNRTWGVRSDKKQYRVPTPPGTPKPADITGGGWKD